MRTQQVPNSPYFIHYDDNGYCCISKSKESQESIPESEMQEFLDAVANGLLYIEKERKSRYQRIDEAEKTAFARGEAEGKEDKLIATVRELEEKQALREEQENKLYHEALSHTISLAREQSGFALVVEDGEQHDRKHSNSKYQILSDKHRR